MSKKLLIAGYPKSGNTWLGYMLSYLLGAKYIDLHVPNQKNASKKWILELIEGKLQHSSEYELVCKTHSLPGEVNDLHSYDKVIHLVRDPRDVAISFFFFQYYNEPLYRENFSKLVSNKPLISQFLYKKRMIYKVTKEWPLFTLSWESQSAYQVKYENLKIFTLEELKKICYYLEYDCNTELLKKAVNLFSFEQLSGGRKIGQDNPYHFFRKGIVGDYKNHFDFLDNFIINKGTSESMKILGYL